MRRDGQVRPSNLLSEPLRRLHTTLQLEGQGSQGAYGTPRSILFLSPDPGDGKSTLAAGLALVQRDADERAVLVEADFRRPVQAKLLGLSAPDNQGLADVLAGTAQPGGAMRRLTSAGGDSGAEPGESPGGGLATVVSPRGGSVSVLLGATGVANPPALLARREMGELLHSLSEDFDGVIVDAPPPLQVSDVMPLLGAVDGIVIVARIESTRSCTMLVALIRYLIGISTPSANTA